MTYCKRCKFKVFSGAIICLKGIRNVVGSIYRGLTPPPVAIIENLLGVITNKVLGIAAELNIAEQLASGAKTIEELADVTQTKPERLLRLMRTLISLGFFKIDRKNRYHNNSASRFLLAHHPQSMHDFVLVFSSPWIFDLAQYAKEVVVTGDSASQLSGSDAVRSYLGS